MKIWKQIYSLNKTCFGLSVPSVLVESPTVKFCHNNSKKKHPQGLPLAGIGYLGKICSYRKLVQPLAWSLPLISILASASTALAQVNTTLNWNDVDFPTDGATVGNYINVEGSGVDIRITVVGADTNAPGANPDNALGDSNFVSPSPADTETLFIPIDGGQGSQATVTIEFFETGTTTPIAVPLAEFQLQDVDVLFNQNNRVDWQDQVEISASAGGTPTTGITAGGEAPPEGTFNQEVIAGNSVIITGVAENDDPNNPTVNANSPRQPGINNNTTTGTFPQGNVAVNFPNPVDTISLILRNGPGTEEFNRHAIAISNIDFQAPNIIPTTPEIGVAKDVVGNGPVETAPGSQIFDITYLLTVENLGNEELSNVQLVEDFQDPTFTPPQPTFGPGNIISASVGTITPDGGATLSANPNYNGVTITDVLAPGATLPIGASATVEVTVQVDTSQPDFPDPGNDGYNNQVTASGEGPSGPVEDDSTDGTDPDPNDDGDPSENTPTSVIFPTPAPAAIGVSKRVVDVNTQADGDFEVLYETTVENLGGVVLNNVQLVEDLNDTYPQGSFSILPPGPDFEPRNVAGEVQLATNPNFNGDTDTDILQPTGQTLPVGSSSTFRFTVEVDNDLIPPNPTPFDNQIEAIGTSPNGDNVDDLSDDGFDPDPNGNDNPADPEEDTPTRVILPPTPVIGVAKQLISAVPEPTGTFGTDTAQITYNIVVANVGSTLLANVQLEEDLTDTFANGVTGTGVFQVVSLNRISGATTVEADLAFNGDTDQTMLVDNTGTLAIGASSTFQLVVDIDTGNAALSPDVPGPYENQVRATAVDANNPNNEVNDLSDDGTQVDPNNNGDPGEPGEDDPTIALFSPDLRLVKRITSVIRGGVEVAIPNIDGFNDQANDTNDNTLATLSGNSLPIGLSNISESLQSGDLVEYTVYFFNAGFGTAENVEMCDELQVPSILQPASLALAQPRALLTTGTPLSDNDFTANGPLSPRAPLSPLEPSCVSAPGTFPSGIPAGGLGVGAGGGVVVGGPTSGLNVDSREVGAFRFEIQLP